MRLFRVRVGDAQGLASDFRAPLDHVCSDGRLLRAQRRASQSDALKGTKGLLKTSGLRLSNWFLNLAPVPSLQTPLKHMLANRLLFQQQTNVCLAKY